MIPKDWDLPLLRSKSIILCIQGPKQRLWVDCGRHVQQPATKHSPQTEYEQGPSFPAGQIIHRMVLGDVRRVSSIEIVLLVAAELCSSGSTAQPLLSSPLRLLIVAEERKLFEDYIYTVL